MVRRHVYQEDPRLRTLAPLSPGPEMTGHSCYPNGLDLGSSDKYTLRSFPAWPEKGQNFMVKWTTLTFKQLAAQKTLRMDAGYWIKQKEKNEKNNNRAAGVNRPAEKLHRGSGNKHAAMAKVRKV